MPSEVLRSARELGWLSQFSASEHELFSTASVKPDVCIHVYDSFIILPVTIAKAGLYKQFFSNLSANESVMQTPARG